jgi:hypothetical protein
LINWSEGGEEIDNWSFEQLKDIVERYIEKMTAPKEPAKSLVTDPSKGEPVKGQLQALEDPQVPDTTKKVFDSRSSQK